MQIIGLHKNIYKLSSYALREENRARYRKLYEEPVRKWDKLKSEGVADKIICEFIGISRSTYYRYKKVIFNLRKNIYPVSKAPKNKRQSTFNESVRQLVLQIRRANPTYGKNKIAVILNRDYQLAISESSVGRIIKSFMQKGLIQTSLSAPRQKRKRKFKNHARQWSYDLKPFKPGEMVQIDHMTVTKNQCSAKHFQAWDPISKYIDANVYSNATSKLAKNFLGQLIKNAPFKITSVQVDGGSEFMKEFEQACKEHNIALYVLPPKRPQYNGGVERGNRIFREEFYARKDILADSIGAIRADLKIAVNKYNSYRPHFNLHGLTPMQYINNFLEAA